MERSLWTRRSFGFALGGLAAGAALHTPEEAFADEKGDKALLAVDNAIFKAKTQYFEYEATINIPDKDPRKLTLAVYLKDQWRFTEFLAPSDVKGTKVLILSPSQMYVYLPAFKKVRRIASHVTDQGFMGMNFAQDEMAITSYAKMFDGAIASEDDKTRKLILTKKKDSEAPYPKLEMTVEKSKNLPTLVKYFSDSGAHIKTETRSEYTCEKEFCSPKTMKMVDHTKNDASTTLSRVKWKVNIDIPDSRFSKRALEEGA
jgi:hypothetical protein